MSIALKTATNKKYLNPIKNEKYILEEQKYRRASRKERQRKTESY